MSLQKHRAESQTVSTNERDNRLHKAGEGSFVSSDSYKSSHMSLLLFKSLVFTAKDSGTGVVILQ